jgi:hypothetical protein
VITDTISCSDESHLFYIPGTLQGTILVNAVEEFILGFLEFSGLEEEYLVPPGPLDDVAVRMNATIDAFLKAVTTELDRLMNVIEWTTPQKLNERYNALNPTFQRSKLIEEFVDFLKRVLERNIDLEKWNLNKSLKGTFLRHSQLLLGFTSSFS